MIFMVPDFDDLHGLPDSLGFFFLWAYDSIGVLALLVQLGSFLVLLLSRMTLWYLFQSLFDDSPDSDIPKNVPFT
jgi:hypothetical protein